VQHIEVAITRGVTLTIAPPALVESLQSRYRLERELGHGGMATVYLARDLLHDSAVALKIPRPEVVSAVGAERFTREIRITSQLRHPSILPVLDSGEVHGLPYYVIPYVEGESLAQRLEREGQLPLPDAVDIACRMAEALAVAHADGFVHRDVKPSNILLAKECPILADFGIARAVDVVTSEKLTESGVVLGTPAYMSPEQAAGGKVDCRSDIYSLGCVLFEMLAGSPPFTGSSAQSVRARHAVDPVPSLRTVRDLVSPSLEQVIVKAMAKVPADRYRDALEFKRALEECDRTTEATVPSRPRARALTLRVASAALAVLGAVAATWHLARSRPSSLDPNRIMVYPLVAPMSAEGTQRLGEDIASIVGNALDGAGPLRWIDGWALLDQDGRRDVRTLTASVARSLAQSKRCAYYIAGRVVSRGDSADLFLELIDVRGDSTLGRGEASGLASETWRLGLRAVNGVLPTLLPSGAPDLAAEWRDRRPAAIASFLLGEAAFRRVHLAEALVHYRDAVKTDSLFGLAAVRGAQAATWNHRSSEATSLIKAAIRQAMPARYTHFARGYGAYLEGIADSAAAEFRRAIRLDPDMSVAWMQLGEVYTHLLPEAGNPDSVAEVAFEEARRLDSSATNLLPHLIEIRLRKGDLAGAEPLTRQFLAADPDTMLASQVRIMDACVRRGPARVDWKRETAAHPLAVLAAAKSLNGGGAQLPCASAAFAAVLRGDTASSGPAEARRWFALIGLQGVLMAQGRTSVAIARLDSAIAAAGVGSSIYLLAGPFFSEFADRARWIATQDRVKFGADYLKCPFNTRLWALALWETHEGNAQVAAAIARELGARALKSGSPRDRLLAGSAAAHAALARRDSAQALQLFAELIPESIPGSELDWDEATPRGADRLRLAELYVARGEFQRGIDIADVFDSAWPVVYTVYLPASLKLRAEAAAAGGDADRSARYRSRLVGLRSDRVVASR
jgi:serine/threonine-protein kinase